MSDQTSANSVVETSPRELQRSLVPTYLAVVDNLVRAASQMLATPVSLPVEWAKRELELASTRLYANQQEFAEEMEEIVREVRQRIADTLTAHSRAAE